MHSCFSKYSHWKPPSSSYQSILISVLSVRLATLPPVTKKLCTLIVLIIHSTILRSLSTFCMETGFSGIFVEGTVPLGLKRKLRLLFSHHGKHLCVLLCPFSQWLPKCHVITQCTEFLDISPVHVIGKNLIHHVFLLLSGSTQMLHHACWAWVWQPRFYLWLSRKLLQFYLSTLPHI